MEALANGARLAVLGREEWVLAGAAARIVIIHMRALDGRKHGDHVRAARAKLGSLKRQALSRRRVSEGQLARGARLKNLFTIVISSLLIEYLRLLLLRSLRALSILIPRALVTRGREQSLRSLGRRLASCNESLLTDVLDRPRVGRALLPSLSAHGRHHICTAGGLELRVFSLLVLPHHGTNYLRLRCK